MASYPGEIYAPKTKENKSDVIYDSEKKKVVFAEDFNDPNGEVVAVETELGTNPKGAKTDVAARLDDFETRIAALEGG